MKHKITGKIHLIFFGIFLGLCTILLLDIYKKDLLFFCYKNKLIETNIENFYLSKNKTLMYAMKSGKRGWIYDTDICINEQGFRDTDFNLKKGKTILCLGSSITFGGDLQENFLYTSKLNDLLGENYSVFNLGVDGYTTIHEAENLRINGIKYKPNVVIVVSSLFDIDSAFYKDIYYAASVNNNKLNVFLCKSKLYFRFIFLPISKVFNKNNDDIVEIYKQYGTIDISNIPKEEIGFKIISDLQKEYNFECYFFILPFFKDFDNYSKDNKNRHIFLNKILNKYPNIKHFDLKDYFMNISTNPNSFINNEFDFVHPNKYGHELIAKFIYEKLKQDKILEYKTN